MTFGWTQKVPRKRTKEIVTDAFNKIRQQLSKVTISEGCTMSATDVQRALTVADSVSRRKVGESNTDAPTPPTLKLPRKEVKPCDEFQKEVALLPGAFPHLFPFGLCGFVNPKRPHTLDDFQDFVCHLMKLTYVKPDGTPFNPFQEDPMFLHYCNNRIHRHNTSNQWTVYLQYQLKDQRLLSEDFTHGDFKKLSPKERAQIINHAVTHTYASPCW